MPARAIPPELELLEALEALEALGLVDVEVNDLGELRVSPTRAGIDAVCEVDEGAEVITPADVIELARREIEEAI
jgi:hypothetical protein